MAAFKTLLFALAVAVAQCCPDGWSYVAGKCVMITLTKASGNTVVCEEGSALAVVHDEEKLTALVAELVNFGSGTQEQAWVGGTYVPADESIVWVDGQSGTTDLWAVGQPNPQVAADVAQCIKIKEGGLNDQKCSEKRHHVCEKDFACPEGQLAHAGHCFSHSEDRMDWDTAQMTCQLAGGDLAIVRDEATLTALVEAFDLTTNGIPKQGWVGGMFRPDDESITWVDNVNAATDLWGAKQPNPKVAADVNQCIKIKNSGLNDQKCSVKRNYICEF